jgi:hypothetical protein
VELKDRLKKVTKINTNTDISRTITLSFGLNFSVLKNNRSTITLIKTDSKVEREAVIKIPEKIIIVTTV